MWWAPQEATKVFLNPPSHQVFFNRAEPFLARSTMAIPPTLFDTPATTNTATRSPSVSTTPKVLRPEISFPASYPLVRRRRFDPWDSEWSPVPGLESGETDACSEAGSEGASMRRFFMAPD